MSLLSQVQIVWGDQRHSTDTLNALFDPPHHSRAVWPPPICPAAHLLCVSHREAEGRRHTLPYGGYNSPWLWWPALLPAPPPAPQCGPAERTYEHDKHITEPVSRWQMGRPLRRLFAISGQRLCGGGEARLMHTAFSGDLARLWIFSSGSNLRARMSVATIIICILTQGWVCYVRPGSGAGFMTFEELFYSAGWKSVMLFLPSRTEAFRMIIYFKSSVLCCMWWWWCHLSPVKHTSIAGYSILYR